MRTNTKQLAQAIASLAKIAPRKATMPILSHVHLYTIGSRLICEATDLEIAMRYDIERSLCGAEKIDITIDARLLVSTLKPIKSETCEISQDGTTLRINGARIVGAPESEYPNIDRMFATAPRLRIDRGEQLSDQELSALIECASQDETRYTMTSICFEGVSGTVEMCATDGHRLALVTRNQWSTLPLPQVIVPRALFDKLPRDWERLEIAPNLDGKIAHSLAIGPNWTMSARNTDGTFPDYRRARLLPTSHKIRARCIDAQQLIDASDQAIAVLGKRTNAPCKLSLVGNHATLTASSPEHGECRAEFNGFQRQDEYGDQAIGFNARYLRDMAASLGKKSSFDLLGNDPLSAWEICPTGSDSLRMILMPQRLDK